MIDLTKLPLPDVIESLDYESILAELMASLQALDPDYSVEPHDPAYKVLEACAYRELLLRQRINQAAQAVMLPYATGTDLDNLAAFYGVERLLESAGDPDAIPPIEPTYESDERLRTRVLLAFDQYSTAGAGDTYRFYALSASADVKDVDIQSPTPGQVQVTVLSTQGNGEPDPSLVAAVDAVLNDEKVRPLTDEVMVQAATVVNYSIEATLHLYPGPVGSVILAAAQSALESLVASNHKLGYNLHASAVYAALQVEGVQRVELTGFNDLIVDPHQAAYCTGITLQLGASDV